MHSQRILFKDNRGDVHIHNNNETSAQKRGEAQNVRLPSEDKEWLEKTASIISESKGQPKYGASTLGCEAIMFFRKVYHVRHKVLKYLDAIEKLP